MLLLILVLFWVVVDAVCVVGAAVAAAFTAAIDLMHMTSFQ